jgi:tetratricopeptide (TPR) repeat protein
MGHEDIAMEYFVAEDKRPVEKCLEDVGSCDLYIGIFAWRYGYAPDGYDKSITELEYQKAVEAGIECLIFLLDEDAPWPPKYVDKGKDAEKIAILRNELSTEKTVSLFKSADELAGLVGAAVHNWENERRIEIPIANQEILSHYNPSTLPYYPERLKKFVTENRADELRKALTYLENHRILLLSGVGGVGKSTLARALIDFRPTNVPEPFCFSFYNNQDAKLGDILEKLAAYMNAPEITSFKAEKREPGKTDIGRLTGELLRRSEVWLIFDDLSMMLEDQHFADNGIELLFSSFLSNTHNAKVIITSRVLPILRNGESLIDVDNDFEKQHLNGLRTDFAVDYLASNGLDKIEFKKLEKLAIGVDGHPLALKLLIKLVKKYGAADILSDLSIYPEKKENTIKKAIKLFDKVAGNEKELLERISVYREPVKLKGLKEMFTENTPKNSVQKLIDKSLLETDNNENYWLHPLVQEFSYDDLEDKKEVHLIAFNYYKSLKLPEDPTKKEDIQPAIEALYHACKAGEYDLAADIIWEFNLHSLLYLWGNYRTLIEIYEKLLPKDHLKDEPILKDKRAHGAVLGNLGLACWGIGEPIKAIEYYEQALKIQREIGDRSEEGNWLGNLGVAYHSLGEPKKAIKYYEQALIIDKEIGDRHGEGNHLGNMGVAYSDLGEPKKVIDCYEQALIIDKEIGDRRGEGEALGNLGVAYSDLGETKIAIEYYEQSLEISREIGDRRGEGAALGNLANAYSNLGELKKAIDYYEQSLKISREIDDRSGEGTWLGNLAKAYYYLGKIKKAIDYYEQSLKISREIGDRRGEGAALGNLGLAYSDLGEPRKAIDYYEQSLEISKEIGDRRGEGADLGNLGNVYSDLGETKKAIDYYEHALKIAREIGDRRGEGNRFGNLGLAYSHLGETKTAIEYYEQALKIDREIGDRRREGTDLGNLGLAYSDLGETKKAIEFLKESLAIGKSIEDPRLINFCEHKLKELEGFNHRI